MEPKLTPKADYGFAARDALAQGLPITKTYEQAKNPDPISTKATYGFAARDMVRNDIPVTENYEEYVGKVVPAPSVISARPAVERLKTDKEMLANIEAGLPIQTSATKQTAGAVAIPNIVANNPALSAAVDGLNRTIAGAGGQLSPEQKAVYDQIQESVNKINSAAAEARMAEAKNDYAGVSTATKEAATARDEYKTLIDKFMTDSKDLRTKYLETLSPTSEETNLKNQIADLEAAAKLGVEAQYGLGRPLSLSTGRAEKVLNQGQIQLQTLTKKLGIMLDEREAKSKGYATAMEMLQNDFDTQFKVEEALYKRQNDTLDRASKLSESQRNAMGTLADKFKNIDVDSLTPEAKLAIQKFATSQGVDVDLAMEIIRGANDQQIFDNLLAAKKAEGTASGSTFGLDPSDPIFGAITGLGSVKAQDAALKRYAGFKASGNQEAAENYLDSVALSTLSQGQKEDFGVYSDGQRIINNVLGDLEKFKSTNLNPYKTAIEKLKPLAGLQKDQVWVDITSQIEQAQARIRRGFFGTALTGTEKTSADKFLIDFASDDIATAETKLKNMRQLATDIKRRLLNEASGNFDIEGSGGATQESKEVDLSDLDFKL